MLWDDDVHGRLPAMAFVEEALEASLSRLSRAAATDLRVTSVTQFSDMYVALGPPLSVRKSSKPGLSKSFPEVVSARCDRLLARIASGNLAFVQPSAKDKYSTVKPNWNDVTDIFVPQRLLVREIHKDVYMLTVIRSLRRLLMPRLSDDRARFAEILAQAPPLSSNFVAQRKVLRGEMMTRLRQRELEIVKGTRKSA